MTEQQELITQNNKLIYYCLHKRNLPIDDWYDIAAIGLCNAGNTYNGSTKFSTYAVKCINNAINMEFRKINKINKYELVSLDKIISDDAESTCSMSDFLNANVDIENEVVLKITFENILKNLNPKQKEILKLSMQGQNQYYIAKKLNISQSNVSGFLNKIKKEILA